MAKDYFDEKKKKNVYSSKSNSSSDSRSAAKETRSIKSSRTGSSSKSQSSSSSTSSSSSSPSNSERIQQKSYGTTRSNSQSNISSAQERGRQQTKYYKRLNQNQQENMRSGSTTRRATFTTTASNRAREEQQSLREQNRQSTATARANVQADQERGQNRTAYQKLEEDRIRREKESRERRAQANKDLNLKQSQMQKSKEANKTLARNAGEYLRQGSKDIKAAMNDYGANVDKEEDRKARQQQKMGVQSRNKTLGIKESSTSDTITGTLKQVVGGHLKSLGDDSNEYSEYVDILDHNLANGKITKAEYNRALENWKRSSTKYNKYKDWEKSKQHETYQKIFKKGDEIYKAGEEQVQSAQEGARGLKKAYLGALGSGVGMATDMVAGPAWFASMVSRTYGGELKSEEDREKLGMTRLENRRYAGAQAMKEVATEAMFSAVGLPAKVVRGKGFLDGVTRRLSSGVLESGVGAALKKYGMGILEENIEEAVGWAADPYIQNWAYGNNVWNRQTRAETKAEGDALRKAVSTMDENEVRAMASHLNSSEYLQQVSDEMMANGASKEEADEIARVMQGYMNAVLSNDEAAEEQYENMIVELMEGKNPNKATHSWSELRDTLASTTLLTGLTGLGGTISTAAMGNAIKGQNGLSYVKGLAEKVKLYDLDDSSAGQAMSDRISEGKDVAGTNIMEMVEKYQKVQDEAAERRQVKDSAAQKQMAREDLRISPITSNEGGYTLGPVTDKAYDSYVDEAMDYIERSGMDVSPEDALDIADAYGAYKTGVISEDQMAVVNTDNAAARTVFSELGGINFNEYTVTDKKGNINAARTNVATEKALYAKAADNFVQSARAEQETWNDTARGEVSTALTKNMAGAGSEAVIAAMNTVDPRDKGKFELTGVAGRRVYEYARNTNDNWADVKSEFKEMFKGVDESVMRDVFNAAKDDKLKAETAYYGTQVTKNSLNKGEVVVVPGSFKNESARVLQNTELATLTSAANELGLNIVMSDALEANENGRYDKSARAITLNAANTMEENLAAIFSHEVTHHLAAYAPEQYIKLSNLIMDSWYKSDAEGFKNEIERIQKLYKDVKGQELSPEAALEEIIADNAADIWSDKQFAESIAKEDASLAKSIINAIKEILSKLRSILSGNTVTDPQTRDNLFSQINVYDEAYKLWTRAYDEVKRADAASAIDQKQDEMNKGGETRYALNYEQSSKIDLVTKETKNNLKLQGVTLIETKDDLTNVVTSAITDRSSQGWYAVGVIEPDTINRIKERSKAPDNFFKENRQYTLQLNNDAIRHIGSHFDNDIDAIVEEIIRLNDIVANYDTVTYRLFANGEKRLVFNKSYSHADIRTVDVVSNKKNSLSLITVFYTQKKSQSVPPVTNNGNAQWGSTLDDNTIPSSESESNNLNPEQVYEKADKAMPNSILREGQAVNNGENEEGRLVEMFHGSGVPNFTEFRMQGGMLGEGAYFTSAFPEACDYAIEKLGIEEKDDYSYTWDGENMSRDEVEERLESEGYVRPFYLNVTEQNDVRPSKYGEGNAIAVIRNKNQAKSSAPITIDDNGDVIPIEKRFDENSDDVRYSLVSPQQDADYMKAVESGDMETAQRMVDEAAEAAGYTENSDYQGTSAFNGAAPSKNAWYETEEERIEAWKNEEYEGEASLGDFVDRGIDINDLDFFLNDPRAERNGSDFQKGSIRALRNAINSDSKTITMYRSVPANIEEGSFRNGDWITPNRDYAIDNAEIHGWDEGYRIIEQEVSIDDIWWDGNDINEWGYDDGSGYAYQNTENNRKLLAPVTYDDNGNVIPLSERFNMANPDIRYSLSPEQQSEVDRIKAKKRTNKQDRQFLRDMGEKLSHKDFNSLYSAHKLNLRGADNLDAQIEDIKTNGFKGGEHIYNLLPASLNDWSLYDRSPNVIEGKYGVRAGETVLLVPEQYNNDDTVVNGFKPLDYEIVTAERDYQPYYELYEKAYDAYKYSLIDTDAKGRHLTEGQMEYFKNSQARDDQGRLIPVFHVTRTAGFTIFDPSRSFDGRSISFSNDIDFALNYSSEDGDLEDWRTAYENRYGMEEVESDLDNEVIGHYEVYLDIQNPLIVTDDLLNEMDIYEIPAYAQDNGYDGVIIRDFEGMGADIYQVFSSNQIKDTRNENPTENPDIRYSITPEDDALSSIAYAHAMDSSGEALEYYEKLIDMVDPETYNVRPFNEEKVADFYAALNADEAVVYSDPVLEEDRVRMARSKADFFNNLNAKWNDRWTTEGRVLDVKSVKTDIRNLVMGVMANSDTNAKYRTELVNKTLMDVRTAYQLMKQDRQEVAAALLYHSAQRMIDGVEFYVDDYAFDDYKAIKDYFKTTRISLGEEYWSDVDFGAFRKQNFGRMKLVKGTTNVDQIYQELAELFPQYFNEEETYTVPDQLEQMAHVLDILQPYKEAYTSEAAAELAFDIADSLYDIMEGGKEYASLADTYKQRFDAKTKAMKQRHAEAMLRLRRQAELGVQAERAKWRAREEARKERTQHKAEFDRIQKTYNELTKRLLTNTKDKHIPEQYKKHLAELLKVFDLQTLRSKDLESKRGYKAHNTIKLEAMKATLERIEAKSQFFQVNDAITDLIDELLGISEDRNAQRNIEGLTIDELNYTELHNINQLLRALLFEFNNYEKVWAEGKRQQAEDIGHKQNDISLEHAKQYGPGKDYQTHIPQAIDQILNLDMVTPAYMFRRIDPNNEGLGKMWKELRRSFDKYVKNTEQLNEWIEEIVGDYHEKDKFWNKYGAGQLTDWRLERSAKTFNLTHGTVSLTPAQMMSIYCLAGRGQAMDHMLNEGIVVSPVSFNAKMLSDVKKKANKAQPVTLTHADIQTIIAQLTPEQISVAQKLQQLMATKMAAWGNEASMETIGIELFKEENYFPIRSDKAGLTKDLDPNQFEQCLRSFGFTKAVKPGAGNAIMVDDIFDVVVDHCNNMNLYNAYTKSVNDFMKVYNFKEQREEGTYSVERALMHAYSEKVPRYIMQFIRDLNGNVHKRNTGMEALYNAMLSSAKKTSVFLNWRVAAQQPTAIERAFYIIDRKYYNPADLAANSVPKVITEDTREMWDHCPIALWKSWGYYDINMGKNIDDIIMNNGSALDDFATNAYGKLDNATWTAIWNMVKREMKDTHPDVKKGTEEYWELCNDRMTEIIDLTQLVDSPMHRSHAMRNKDYWSKTKTAFAGEPTITFNMLRDGLLRTNEARKTGNYKLAGKILARTLQVYVMQTIAVSAAQAFVDALRFKNPDPDDDDDRLLHLFWVNFKENFKDEINPITKVYVAKDWWSAFQGWQNRELATNGIDKLILGWRQLNGDPYARSSTPWYFNLADGLGYLYGVPVPTMRKAIANMMRRFGLESPALNAAAERLDNVVQKEKDGEDKVGFTGMLIGAGAAVEDKLEIDGEGFFGKLLTKVEAESGGESSDSGLSKKEEAVVGPLSEEDLTYKALKASAGMEDGEEKNKKIYSAVAEGMKSKIENGEYHDIAKMRKAIEAAGGDVNYFDQQVIKNSKTALKKSIKFDATPEEINDQALILHYLVSHGVSQEEISRDIVYESDAAKDMKVAFKTGDEELIQEAMKPLVEAGITEEDLDRLYQNRNRMKLENYNGKYKDRLKSTGTYIWPTPGVIQSSESITSYFGYRNAPTAGASSNHPAIDIGAPEGSEVVAADGGTVIYVGYNGGYGNSVGIKHDNGMVTYYNHLSGYSVNEGDVVAQGQYIAAVGSTGVSTGPHLDFKVLDENGDPVDPLKFLEEAS